MEADRILRALEDHLTPLVTAAGGTVSVSDNPWDVLEMLKVTPAQWRLIISLEDEKSVDDRNPGGWTAGIFTLYVQVHRGFQAQPGLTIHRATPAARVSMSTRCGQVRAWMRAIQFNSNQDIAKDDASHFAFIDAQWVDGTEAKDKPCRVRRMDFQLVYALDDPNLGGETAATISVPPFGGLVPTGGTTGQALVKLSSDNFDVGWADVESGGTGSITFEIVGQYLHVTEGGVTKRLRLLDLA